MSEPAAAVPVSPADRIEVVDALRGFAIFGILLVNMEGMSSPGYRSESGERLWTGTADRIAESLIAHGASGKFIFLFTVLFGLGFAIVQQRAADRNLPIASIQARRLLVLLGIGLVHGLGIWYGDILVSYALAGGLLFLFRRCRPRTLLIWGILLNLLSFAQVEVETYRSVGATLQAGSDLTRPAEGPEAQSAAAEAALAAYGQGSFSDIMRQRAEDFWTRHQEIQNTILRRLSFFLFGLFVGRIGLMRALPRHRTVLLRALRWALAVGILAHLARLVLSLPQLPAWTRLLRLPTSIIGNPALACVYAIGIILLFEVAGWRRRLLALAAVGRTALSNYLLQSVICTTIFYSYGFGLYGRVGPAAGMGLSVLIFAVQVPASVWWLRRFQFGPAEWIWRSLTYGQPQPLRIAK